MAEVTDYLPHEWRAYLGANNIAPNPAFDHPGGNYLPATPDGKVASAQDIPGIQAHLDHGLATQAILIHDIARSIPGLGSHYLGRALAKAVNDWTVERFLDAGDHRIHAAMLVPTQFPDECEREIRRLRNIRGVAAVLLATNPIGRPYGHPFYHPIFAAAAKHDMPILIHVGSEASPDSLATPTAGGLPTLFTELYVLAGQALQTHIVSMIAQGVFDRYPNLRVLVSGGGVGWVPWLLWRLNSDFRAHRYEVPWLRMAPADYFMRHFWVTAYPWEPNFGVDGSRLVDVVPGIEGRICFSSGYPKWDTVPAAQAAANLREEWRSAIMNDNAAAFLGWGPQAETNAQSVATNVGEPTRSAL